MQINTRLDSARLNFPWCSFPIIHEPIPRPPKTQRNKSLELTDSTYLHIAPHENPMRQGPFTIETWFRATQLHDWQSLIANLYRGGFGIMLNRDKLTVYLTGDNKKLIRLIAPKRIKTQRWYHVATVYDPSSLRLYLNGRQVAQTQAPKMWRSSTHPLTIGARHSWQD
ncbi:MAG: LamG domain-containing protein [Myxococcota bacterium]